MNEITLTLEELARLTEKNATELKAELTNAENGEPLPKEKQTEIIKGAFSSKFSKLSEDSRKRGIKEGLKSFEKKAAEEYGVDSYTDATDLVSKIVKKSSQQLDEKTILKHPVVAAKINEARNEVEAIKQQMSAKITEATQAAQQAANKTEVLRVVGALNLALSSDEKKKNQQIKHLVSGVMQGLKTEKAADGKIYVLDSSGQRLRNNETFSDVTLSEYVKGYALNIYDVKTGGNNPPTFNGGGGNGNAAFTREDVENRAAYIKKRKELATAKDKAGAAALFAAREKFLKQQQNK